MEIPGLGAVTKDREFGWYSSEPISVPVLGPTPWRIVVQGYDEDPRKEDFHSAIANFLQIPPSVLRDAEPHIFRYYEQCNSNWEPCDEEFIAIASPAGVWDHVQLHSEPRVKRRGYGGQEVYVSLFYLCDWEPELGLQVVFKHGLWVNKVGPYDDHLTNSDAYDNDELEDVVFVE